MVAVTVVATATAVGTVTVVPGTVVPDTVVLDTMQGRPVTNRRESQTIVWASAQCRVGHEPDLTKLERLERN